MILTGSSSWRKGVYWQRSLVMNLNSSSSSCKIAWEQRSQIVNLNLSRLQIPLESRALRPFLDKM